VNRFPVRFRSFLCCRQPAGSEYVCAHVGHCRCGRFLEWAAKSMSNLWSILARRKTWSSIRLLSSKMSGRCHNSEKDGCSSPPLTSGACCLESIAALVESPGGASVPVVPSRGVSSSTKQVGKKSSELLALRFCRVSPGGSLLSFSSSIEGWLCIASSKLISSTYAMGGVHGRLLRRVDAMASARSNFRCRWRRDSALYQAAPLRDFPLSLGIVETLEGARVPVGLASLLPSFSGALSFCSDALVE
jgi:hypothetical protein